MRHRPPVGLFLVFALATIAARPACADSLFVSSFGNDTVYRLDAQTGAVLQTFNDPLFLDSPTGLALSPDGSILYVGATNSSNADVYTFDVATGARTGAFNSSLTGARGLALSGDGATLYVAGIGSDNVMAFDTATGSPSLALSGGLNNPQGILLAPDGGSLFIANSNANDVLRRALPGGSTLQTYPAPASFYAPSDVALSPDGSTLYVSTFGDSAATNNQVLRYEVASGNYLGSWTLPAPDGDLYGLAITPDGSSLFVTDVFNSRILRVDTSDGSATIFSTPAALNNPAFLLYVPTSVPEPGSLALIGMGLAVGLGAAYRRRRAA
jgi:DNA-binding beta-propeller fold protein YncE